AFPVRLRRGARLGHEANGVALAPHLIKARAAKFSFRPAFGVVDEVQRGAAVLFPAVVPNTFANVVGARAVGVAAVPAKLFLGSFVRLAPELAACGLAVLSEVGQVGHAPPLLMARRRARRAPRRSPGPRPARPPVRRAAIRRCARGPANRPRPWARLAPGGWETEGRSRRAPR